MKKHVVLIFLLALILRLIFMREIPFYKDEALYAEIIEETTGGSFLPHYAGVAVAWKPPLMFWVYSTFAFIFGQTGLPPNFLYRLPSVLLGSACAVLVYLLIREISKEEDLAFISGIAYAGNGLGIAVDGMLMADTLLITIVLGALLCYVKAKERNEFLLFGGLLTAMAIFTKTLMGLLAPVLAIIYYATTERRKLLSREFLLSLLFVPLAFILLYALIPGAWEQFIIDSSKRVNSSLESGYFVGQNLIMLGLTLPWLAIAVYGIYKYRKTLKDAPFWYSWLIMGLLPLFVSGPLYWYFLPLLPVLSFFSANIVLADKKADFLAIVFAISLVLLSIPGLYVYEKSFQEFSFISESKDLGHYLAEKDSLFIGFYNPTFVYYKFHGNWNYSSLDAFFLLNHSVLSDKQLEDIIMSSKLPGGSIHASKALMSPYLSDFIHIGRFERLREFVAVERTVYYERIYGRTEYSWLKVVEETEYFVVLRRES